MKTFITPNQPHPLAERPPASRSQVCRKRLLFQFRVIGAALLVGILGSSPIAQALMEFGDEGPGVRLLQQELGVTPTGYYGAGTRDAVAGFQAENGLLIDGVAGPETLAALGLPSNLEADQSNAADSATIATGRVASKRVNVYSEPSLRSTVRSVLFNRDRVSFTNQSVFREGNRWQELAGGGWVIVNRSNEAIGGIGGDQEEVDVRAQATVTASSLIVRDAPAGEAIGSLGYGTPIALTGNRRRADGLVWVQLASGAWVAEDFIEYR
jgi:hypothetical protein